MLEVPISPVIFRIGFIQVTYYALVYLIGFLIALFLLLKAAKRKEINLKEGEVYDFMFFGILGLLIGARLFHVVFWGLDYYLNDPKQILFIWQGGFSFHGGLAGSIIAAALFCKFKKLNFWKFADFFAVFGIIMPAFSRIANFINQEIVGTVTNLPWCFKFQNYEECRHPVQLYASFARFLFFSVFISWRKRIKEYKQGFWFWLFIFVIGLGRFFLDFLREDPLFLGLKAGQWLSVPMILIGAYVLLKSHKSDLKKIFLL